MSSVRVTFSQRRALDLMGSGPFAPSSRMQARSFQRLVTKDLARLRSDGAYELTELGDEIRRIHPGRPSQFAGAWGVLAELHGGPAGLAKEIGVSYQTTWRWANNKAEPPGPAARVIEALAETAGVENPLKSR